MFMQESDEEGMSSQQKRWYLRRNVLLGISAGVIALILFIFLAPVITEKYLEEEPYIETETYIETEPYTVTETYYESEPYTTLVPLSYLVTGTDIQIVTGQIASDCRVFIYNSDSNSGTFTVTFNLVTMGGARITKQSSQFIAGGTQQSVGLRHNGDYIHTFSYTVLEPTKEVVDYHDVQKTREVIKYRDVEKTREVIRYRDIEKSRQVSIVGSI